MPRKRRAPEPARPAVEAEQILPPEILAAIAAAWEDFKAFIATVGPEAPPPGVTPERVREMHALLAEREDVLKSVFGSGFVGGLEMLRQLAQQEAERAALEHLGGHHRADPRIPRA